ncbi:MAG TPA: retropepsin-like aspartic protease [Rhizomicrobium sp.]|nr:retropepsin-like aspartic protease [Rhizomicrobium sp.]
MRQIAWLTLCGLLATWSNAQAADCPLKMLGTVDIKVLPNELQVPVTFGDAQKNFIFDIGSPFNLVTQETARQAGFHIQSMDPNITIHSFGQKVERLGYSPKFRLGSLPGDDVEFAVLPGEMPENDVAGLLGIRLFERLDFELDISRAKLNIFSPDHCPEQVVYWTKTGFAELPFRRDGALLSTEMLLDGKPIRATLSTRQGSVIGMNVVRQLFGLDGNSPGMVPAGTAPNGRKYYHYPFKGLTVDALTINHPDILIEDEDPAICNNKPRLEDEDAPKGHVVDKPMNYVTCYSVDMDVGLSVLRKLHVYFSSREKIMYVTPAGAQ